MGLANKITSKIPPRKRDVISPIVIRYPKDRTIWSVKSPHPSTKIKSMSLKGMEIITGGSIIIPIDIRALATIISITINGINKKIPILNATVSSFKIKAGIKT